MEKQETLKKYILVIALARDGALATSFSVYKILRLL